MTRTLILMRHAKSSWASPVLADHDRPLNGRGKRSATALGNWLRAQGLIPDEVLCSTSTRTAQTFERLKLDIAPTYTRGLYHADPNAMWQVLARAVGDRVLMLGHNPGIAAFAHQLVANAPAHDRFWDYPTGATLVVEFAADRWPDVQPGTGQARGFVTPRELTE